MASIGDLFLTIKIDGNPAIKALASVKNALFDLSNQGLIAKAKVAAVLYGLERFTMSSAEIGLSMQKFGIYTGISTLELQKWQSALIKTGVDADQVQDSFTALQGIMANARYLGQLPAGWGQFVKTLGLAGINMDVSKTGNTPYMMEMLKKYLQTEKNPEIRRLVSDSFGVIPDMAQGLMSYKGNVADEKAPWSKKTQADLAKTNILWKEFWRNLELAKGQLVAQYGPEVIKLIKDITDSLLKHVPEMIKLFQHFGANVESVFKALFAKDGPIARAVGNLDGIFGVWGGRLDTIGKLLNLAPSTPGAVGPPSVEPPGGSIPDNFLRGLLKPFLGEPPAPGKTEKHSSMNFEINNYGNFSPEEHGEAVKVAANQVFRNMQQSLLT